MEPALVSPATLDAPTALELKQHFLRGIVRAAAAGMDGLAAEAMETWCERGVMVLSANLAAGRFKLTDPPQPGAPTLLAYARQVVNGLAAEWQLIEHLREGEITAWTAARQRLERLAYYWLGPHGREAWAAWEAREIAAKTCADLWQWLQAHTFPFDVPFDRWATRALTNRLQQATRKRVVRSRHEVDSLDRPVFDLGVTLGETIAASSVDTWLEAAENREVLLQALGRLDARAAAVVRMWYFEGWPGDEIAAALGLTLNNVYIIRFRTVQKLRKLLAEDERFGLAEALQRLDASQRRFPPDPVPQESEAPHG